MEVVLVVSVIGVLSATLFPPLVRARAKIDVAAARDAFAATHALARHEAVRYGALGRLHVHEETGRFWVTVDTASRPGTVALDTVGPVVGIGSRRVTMESNRELLCFSPRGLGTAVGSCDLPNATVVFRRGSVADTITISRIGRLLKR